MAQCFSFGKKGGEWYENPVGMADIENKRISF
jgi:hypothetical protein